MSSTIHTLVDYSKKHYTIDLIKDEDVHVPVVPPEDIHYYIMSDSVCIYINDDISHALPILTALCMHLQVRMLRLDTPVFIRGSIARGEIYEDNGTLFGPALVEAYLRAEKLARFPRVIIPPQLYEETTDSHDKALLNGFAHIDFDGFYTNYYIDYFCMHNSTIPYRKSVDRYINDILNTSLDQSLREKYLYVKSRMEYCYNLEDSENSHVVNQE